MNLICPACHQPLIERDVQAYTFRWCACVLCGPCARGIVARCPACGAGAPDPDEWAAASAPGPEPPDTSGIWRWIIAALLLAVALIVFSGVT